MPEQKPDNKFVTAAKLIAVCVICFGTLYGIVSLINFLTA
jgi:uncharacterized membrane protein